MSEYNVATAQPDVAPNVEMPAGPDATDAVSLLASSAPGPAMIAMLAGLDPTRLDAATRIELLRAYERAASWLAAGQARVLASVADGAAEHVREHGPGVTGEWAGEEVATALRLSPRAAQHRLVVATALVRRLPATLAQLERGDIAFSHAAAVADATTELSGAATLTVEHGVLPRASRQTVAALRAALRRAVIEVDPAGAADRRTRAAGDRRVEVRDLPDGMAVLRAVLAAESAMVVKTALDALADRRAADGDERGAAARRADALVEVFRGALDRADLPVRHGARPHISVTVAADTLLGLDEAPGELAGYGAIPAPAARAIATDGQWRRLLTEPATGALLDYGRSVYRPPADLQRYVVARDGTCRFPGCVVPAHRCDIDHVVPFEDGGSTDRANCGALCRRHHRAKHEGGWRLVRHGDDSCTWTSPTGQTYVVEPPRPAHAC